MNNTTKIVFPVCLALLVTFASCQKQKPRDARALSQSDRETEKFIPYFPDKQPSHTFRNHVEETVWQKHFDQFSPKPGSDAPDFELADIAGTTKFRLGDYKNKQSVALIFGSFT